MKYFLLVAFLVPAFVAAWCWPWLMDFYVVSQHGQRWANCAYLAGVALPMIVFCVLILGVEWLASRAHRRVVRGILLDPADCSALGRGWIIHKVARAMGSSEPALPDDVQLAAGDELIRIALRQYEVTGREMAAAADAFAKGGSPKRSG